MQEHTILVAFTVEADTREQAHDLLMSRLPKPGWSGDHTITSWWVAEDDRRDRSDNDSAIFVPIGQQRETSGLLADFDLTPIRNVVPADRRG